MKVFITIASSSNPPKRTMRSCREILRRDGDAIFEAEEVSHGHVTRGSFLLAFLERRNYDAWLMLDGDQLQPPDLLEKLRESMEQGGLDMVCAHSYRRSPKIESLCFPLGDGTWPYQPYLDPPTAGLHELAMTGMGCVLIHRRVAEAVQALMPPGRTAVDIQPLPQMTGDYRECGSDFIFFTLARWLGYRLWLRADVESLHHIEMLLGHKSARKMIDYTQWADDQQETFQERLKRHGMTLEALRQRRRILEARKKGLLIELENHQADPPQDPALAAERQQQIVISLHNIDGRLFENAEMIAADEKYPPITRPDQLPTAANTPPQNFPGLAEAERLADHQAIAAELAADLDGANGNH